MWSARKIPMMTSADIPWPTRSAAGTGWTSAGAGAFPSARKDATTASAQHATQNHVSGTGSPSIVSTTPMKVNNVGAASARSAMRLARSCASVGWRISAKYIAATSAVVGTAKARSSETAAVSQGSAPTTSLLVIVVTLALKPVRM
jgi:hypothetical protein